MTLHIAIATAMVVGLPSGCQSEPIGTNPNQSGKETGTTCEWLSV